MSRRGWWGLRGLHQPRHPTVNVGTTMKPLIYGYMRVTEDMGDGEIHIIETQLVNYAAGKGFDLATIFHEYDSGSLAAFGELLQQMRRARAHHLVVASLEQLTDHPLIQNILVCEAKMHARAALHETANAC